MSSRPQLAARSPVLRVFYALLAGMLAFCSTAAYAEINPERAARLVAASESTLRTFAADPDMAWFDRNIGDAKGVLVVPRAFKGGFIWGGSAGNGVLLARDRNSGQWSHPAFYTLGSVTFGFQIGGEVSEVVLLVMTERGMDAMSTSNVKLGGDISVALGPVGAGAKAQIADILAFARTKGGLYAGLNLEGSVIKTRGDYNSSFYGEDEVSTADILFRGTARNGTAQPLRDTISRIAATRRYSER